MLLRFWVGWVGRGWGEGAGVVGWGLWGSGGLGENPKVFGKIFVDVRFFSLQLEVKVKVSFSSCKFFFAQGTH